MRLTSDIINWNIRFPIDRWWRNKHSVAFNSPEHRESNFIDQMYEYQEEVLYNGLLNSEYDPFAKRTTREPEFKSEADRISYSIKESKDFLDQFPEEL